MRTCYVNGRFVSENEAQVSIFDRGFLFSDGVYEVSLVLSGKLVDNERHLARLARSCQKLAIPPPASDAEIVAIQQQLIEKNQLHDGAIYLQVTRGSVGDRDFLYPNDIKPSLVLFTQAKDLTDHRLAERGMRVMTVPEIRWAYRDIKAVSLLGAVLVKKAAHESGFDDAWFIENDCLTEGSSNNIFLIKGNEILTKAANSQILNGITRQATLEIATERGLSIVEREFGLADIKTADEAFVTSATLLITPVVQVDDITIGDGTSGKIALAMRQRYIELARA